MNDNGLISAYPNGAMCNPGLTKRELFAAMAMQGWLAGQPTIGNEKLNGTAEHAAKLAESAVRYADALLSALEAK